MYKENEIKEYAIERIKEGLDYNPDYLKMDQGDLHHQLFNEDYYIIGHYTAQKWLGDKSFDIIGIVQDYEKNHFGEVTTDLSSAESVVNMYVYIVGEKLIFEDGIISDELERLSREIEEFQDIDNRMIIGSMEKNWKSSNEVK
jgi:hypothetical protein|tara:strand:- start:3851 stop:4279 length:429 start_codon:yes stop_codon:yes gene_type:complete